MFDRQTWQAKGNQHSFERFEGYTTAYKEVIVSHHRTAVEKKIKTKLEIQYLEPQTIRNG